MANISSKDIENNSTSFLIQQLSMHKITSSRLLKNTLSATDKFISKNNSTIIEKFESSATESAINSDISLLTDSLTKSNQCSKLCGVPKSIYSSDKNKENQYLIDNITRLGAVLFAIIKEIPTYNVDLSSFKFLTENEKFQSSFSIGAAAASINSGVGTICLGQDIDASFRLQAAIFGLVGFKPSSRYNNLIPQKLSTYGVITNRVSDAKIIFSSIWDNVKNSEPANSSMTQPTAFNSLAHRVIISENLDRVNLIDDVRFAFRKAINHLKTSGYDVINDIPNLIDKNICGHIPPLSAQQINKSYNEMFERNSSSIFITPSISSNDFRVTNRKKSTERSASYLSSIDSLGLFFYDSTIIGLPSCTVPVALGKNKQPISLHITGPIGSDKEVLETSQVIEAIIDLENI